MAAGSNGIYELAGGAISAGEEAIEKDVCKKKKKKKTNPKNPQKSVRGEGRRQKINT